MSDVSYYAQLLRQIYQDRRWILAFESLGATTELCEQLLELNAQALLPLCSGRGSGPAPPINARCEEPLMVDAVVIDGIMGGIHGFMEATANLPPEVHQRVDAFDPSHQARVIAPFYDQGAPLAGRAKWGARCEAWQQLEDKTIIDAIWDEIGVERAPSLVVPAEAVALLEAHRTLDRGHGTVWSGDNRMGFNGGAEFVRWVDDDQLAQEAARFFAERCDQVRVAPFLEGIPCSVHGIVIDDYTVALRPCEMLVFRRLSPQSRGTFHYASAATFWDPPVEQRERMRDIARKVGGWLSSVHQYRGAFTVDGIMTHNGFIPTELNPRFGAALRYIDRAIDGLGLLLLNMALIEGARADWRPELLERLLLEAADQRRGGRAMIMATKQVEVGTFHLAYMDGVLREVEDVEQAQMTVNMGPMAQGSHISVVLIEAQTPIGPSVAARVLDAFTYIDERWSLGLGELQAAVDVHRASTPC